MSQPADHEARISRLEVRVEQVAADAAAARHLAAAADRDLSDLGVKVDTNRKAINALGEQTRARFDQVDARFDQVDARIDLLETKVDAGFAYMTAKFDEMDRGFAYMTTRFAEMDRGFAEMDRGFIAMRHGFDQSAAGFARIAELIAARDDDR